MHVAVVGGGTIGLHCALALLKRQARVTVIAASHTPMTVSDNAGDQHHHTSSCTPALLAMNDAVCVVHLLLALLDNRCRRDMDSVPRGCHP